MKMSGLSRLFCCVAVTGLVAISSSASAAPVITTVNADLSANPYTISFLGSSITLTGTGGFPDYLTVATTGSAAVRTVFGGPSTDFPGRGSVEYGPDPFIQFGQFASPTTIRYSNGDNFLGLRVTSGGENYYGFLYTTDTTLNSFAFETRAGVGITPTTDQAVASVPEPASWAMMIVGFGAVGGAMRRRRTVAFA